MKVDILVIGGGTGGHLFPAIATLEEFTKRGGKGILVTDDRCEKYLKNHKSLKYCVVKAPRLEGLLGKIKYPALFLGALIKFLIIIYRFRPKLIIGFGGYVSYPALYIAKLLGKKIMLHEQNCFLGRVNRFFSKSAEKLCLAFEDTLNIPENYPKSKIVIVGNPVRSEITEAVALKKIDKNLFRILITGGSQGATFLSETIPEALHFVAQQFPNFKFQITQQARPEDIDQIKSAYNSYKIEATISDFFYNMPELLANSDLLIGRAGASTIAEIISTTIPAILIPYPHAAQKHQHYNAEMIEKNGGGCMIDQDDASAFAISVKIISYIIDEKKMKDAKKALKKLQKDSAHIIVDTAEKIIHKHGKKA
jgi:UDP-N-acetylglucosamine--N-acetylmuramyl-(pentapeptide) pyrophosphoryl-undecaprenol N-acetylglucosamine transferase